MSELPLLIFTVLTGLAAGGFVMSTIYSKALKAKDESWVFPVIVIVLLGVGMLCVLFHLGRPERFMNALANPEAMIAEEAYWSIAFGVLLVIDAVLLKLKKSAFAVQVLGSIAACGLMVVTSIAYFTSYGIPEWPHVPTILLFICGDVAMGSALAIAYGKQQGCKGCAISNLVFAALAIVAFISEAVVFSGDALQLGLFIAAAAVALVSLVIAARYIKRPMSAKTAWIAFTLMAVAVIVSRFAFYTVA